MGHGSFGRPYPCKPDPYNTLVWADYVRRRYGHIDSVACVGVFWWGACLGG